MNHIRLRKTYLKKIATNDNNQTALGEILKRKRREHNMTQEALTKGICSVSYYSKVENNKMAPQGYFIEEIGTRLDIDLNNHFQTRQSLTIVDRMCRYFLYGNAKRLKKIRTDLTVSDPLALKDLIDLTIAILEHDQNKASSCISALEPLINTMDKTSSQWFMMMCAIDSYRLENYKGVIILLTALEISHHITETLKAIEQHYLFLAKQHLDLRTSSIDNYNQALVLWTRFHLPDRILELNLYRIYFMIQEDASCAKRMLDCLEPQTITKPQHNFYIYLSMRLNEPQELDQARQALNPDECDIWYYKALNFHAKTVNLHPDNDSSGTQVDYDKVPNHSEFLMQRVDFTADNIDDSATRRDYLKDIALPVAIEKQNIHFIDCYTEQLIKYACDNARYKEAVSYKRKRDKAIDKLKTFQ